MLNIKSILAHISNSIAAKDPRYVVKDFEHIIDTKTGIELHVYDNWFKVTYNDENVVTKDDFTTEEQSLVWEIKKLITPPDILKQRKDQYQPLQLARRKHLSDLFENPTPLANTLPVEEQGTTVYKG